MKFLSSRLAGFLLALGSVFAAPVSQAKYIFEPLHTFQDAPRFPAGKLIQGSDGAFYGVCPAKYTPGSVFRVTTAGAVTPLHFFNGADGNDPADGVAWAPDGSIYGMTRSGGTAGLGTVYRIAPDRTFTTLLHFDGANGRNPAGALLRAADGNLYGVTEAGGSADLGTVFRITPAGELTTLVHFDGSNGSTPLAGLIQGPDGTFYGTTSQHSISPAFGSVFRMEADGTFLYQTWLQNHPAATLCLRADGHAWGTTRAEGNHPGSIFKVSPEGTYEVYETFADVKLRGPRGGLVESGPDYLLGMTETGWIYRVQLNYSRDGTTLSGNLQRNDLGTELVKGADGKFYGLATEAGSSGVGRVFRCRADGYDSQTFANFYHPTGENPAGSLVRAADGNYYGSMTAGGPDNGGTIYKLTPAGAVTVIASSPRGLRFGSELVEAPGYGFYGAGTGEDYLYGCVFGVSTAGVVSSALNFRFEYEGAFPGMLTKMSNGNYYGTAANGGYAQYASGVGSVFRLGGAEPRIFTFPAGKQLGAYPNPGLTEGATGAYYGTTPAGGANGVGNIFRVTGSGGFSVIHSFTTNGVRDAAGPLMRASDGNLYGLTNAGGANDRGVVYKVTPAGAFSTIYSFATPPSFVNHPRLVEGPDGALYGAATLGTDESEPGIVFRLTTGGAFERLHTFGPTGAMAPSGSLTPGENGRLYGVARHTTTGNPSGGPGQLYRMNLAPTATTLPAGVIDSANAVAKASVMPGSYSATVSFHYGRSPTLATYTTVGGGTRPAGIAAVNVEAPLGSLTELTTYYYRVAVNYGGDSEPVLGAIGSFTTPATVDLDIEGPDGQPFVNGSGSASFGTVVLGARRELTLTLRNKAPTVAVKNIQVEILGADVPEFFLMTAPASTLAANSPVTTTTLTLRFTPVRSGTKDAALRITSNDPDESPFLIAVEAAAQTPFEAWRAIHFDDPSADGPGGPTLDEDHDSLNHLLEFAFGTDPKIPLNGPLEEHEGVIVTRGAPIIRQAGEGAYAALFIRRKDRQLSGLEYRPKFSHDLISWHEMEVEQQVLTADGEVEIVSVHFPPLLPDGEVPRYFRVHVTAP